MTELEELMSQLTARAKEAKDPVERGLCAVAAAIAATGTALARELRVLSIGDVRHPGVIEDLGRHIGERLGEIAEVLGSVVGGAS